MQTTTTEATTPLTWTDAVQRVSALAHTKLPEALHGRLERATALVLSGGVFVEEDGHTCQVRASNGQGWYAVNGHCRCTDHTTALGGLCKHRLAHGIYRRASELVRAGLPTPTAALEASIAPRPTPEPSPTPDATTGLPGASQAVPATPLPEAPVSITLKATLHGHEVLVTLRGVDFASVKVQVEAASQWLQAQAGPAAADTPQCPKHGVPMKLNRGKDGSTWYSHKTLNGWCKGR
jgi:hypothetical protein